MNCNETNTMRDDGYEHLDSDLAAFARMLDDAGATDRSRLNAQAIDRMSVASLASLHGIVETSAQLSELGAIDRAAAASELEDRIFDASRNELADASSGLRLAGEGAFPRPTVVVRSAWSAGRVRMLAAAALLLASASVVTYIGVQQGTNSGNSDKIVIDTTPATESVEMLAAKVSTQMDTLFVAMEGLSTTSTESTDSEFNPEWLDDLGTSGTSGGGAS